MEEVERVVKERLKTEKFTIVEQASGGIVNAGQAFICNTDIGNVFVKYNDTQDGRPMFHCEFDSLKAMLSTNSIRTPRPIELLEYSASGAVLVIEALEDLKKVDCDATWRLMGQQVAQMHKHNLDLLEKEGSSLSSVHHKPIHKESGDGGVVVREFGFHVDHYLGPFFHVPGNSWQKDWLTYFTRNLLGPTFDQIREKQNDKEISEMWSYIQRELGKIFKDRISRPSLLHGDLFEINVGQVNGTPVAFDPQCYYGDHEMEAPPSDDFPGPFTEGYDSVLPPSPGAPTRKALYQLFTNVFLFLHEVDMEDNKTRAIEEFKKIQEFCSVKE